MQQYNEKQTSDKKFGGNSLPAGNYVINRSLIVDATMTVDGATRNYDALIVVVNDEQGVELAQALQLNGCWRAHRDAEGKRQQASGSFYDQVLKACAGKSFTETRDYINASLKGKKIAVAYTEYPSASRASGFGYAPKVNFIE